MTNRPAKDNSKALGAFTEAKADIDTLLARLQCLSDGHFNASPDEINWSDVGTLAHSQACFHLRCNLCCHQGCHP